MAFERKEFQKTETFLLRAQRPELAAKYYKVCQESWILVTVVFLILVPQRRCLWRCFDSYCVCCCFCCYCCYWAVVVVAIVVVVAAVVLGVMVVAVFDVFVILSSRTRVCGLMLSESSRNISHTRYVNTNPQLIHSHQADTSIYHVILMSCCYPRCFLVA